MKLEDICAYEDLYEVMKKLLKVRFLPPANETELYRAMLRENGQKSKDNLPYLAKAFGDWYILRTRQHQRRLQK
jgi:hypothetical protein